MFAVCSLRERKKTKRIIYECLCTFVEPTFKCREKLFYVSSEKLCLPEADDANAQNCNARARGFSLTL
jgi:hypothetical protein